eukprot:TRINITY_DN79761_c0_g1_i1.p1 TRINITY_DN79761_c0_g1~~TRINITY_DN79761_c0_g1_i1.p1  ORF type:complete len:416 (-),score=58.56 TRINITY_DN79761_c0_g1_i1:163-1368(-)
MAYLLALENFNAKLSWLATQPPLDRSLVWLANQHLVQDVSFMLIGTRSVPHTSLLSVCIMFLLLATFVLITIPKARLGLWSMFYFILSADKKPNKPNDIQIDMNSPRLKRMKIVFIRHGESQWNAVFNKGWKIFMPIRLVKALFKEGMMLFERDSIFFDSPLNDVGIQQGWDLLAFLASQPAGCRKQGSEKLSVQDLEPEDIVSIIRGDVGESAVVSSILRRAISTGLLCLSPRFLKSKIQEDRVMLMTPLQEISRNVDTLALTPAKTIPKVPQSEANLKDIGDLMSHFYRTRLDKKQNSGNKTFSLKANKRQDAFIDWVFKQPPSVDCVIVAGHSLWFREFFKSYLPKSSTHVAKTAKMVNCGVVAFDLYQMGEVKRILPESVKEIYGGFEVKKKKEKKA